MVRIAACQLSLNVEDSDYCLSQALDAISQAISNKAEIIILPELSTSGYCFQNLDEVRVSSQSLNGEFIAKCLQLAKDNDVVIIAGMNIENNSQYWNASIVIDNSGVLGWYAKAHLFADEGKFFTPGLKAPLVVNTSKGRIATMICYDIEFSEWVRLAMLQGAQLLALPTNWPEIGQTKTSPPMEVIRVQAAASQNKLVIAAADRCTTERDQKWVSSSVITTSEGIIAALADSKINSKTQIIYANVELPTDTAITDKNDVRKDRRPSLYSPILDK
jgi:predicted amidohydrolase